ncbi:hypothetical protein [uncultured Gilliamella sp.]|uniref:hypothetical protein n=1 Tax=uncultured Gilliamella sp. TaxID=1193505 RepID=UPI0025CE7B64|nr:hypothetical protein [uncultured Gilliamella sp.]
MMKKFTPILMLLISINIQADPKDDYKEAYVTPVFKDIAGFPFPDITLKEWNIENNIFLLKYKEEDIDKVVDICKKEKIPDYSENGDQTLLVKTKICNKAKIMSKLYHISQDETSTTPDPAYSEAWITPVFKDIPDFPLPDITADEWQYTPLSVLKNKYEKTDIEKMIKICKENKIPFWTDDTKNAPKFMQSLLCNKAESLLRLLH